jgi:uncharacterized protein YbjT (DUF2867 family)
VILVTGATSATGSRLAQRLVQEGESLRCFVHVRANEHYVPRDAVEVIYGDLANPSDVERALRGISVLINVAHIRFAHQIVPLAERAGISRALFISSTRKYTQLDDPVAEEVARAEEVVRRSGLRYTILRPSMIYGDMRDRNVSRLVAIVSKLPVIPLPRGGKNLVQPVFVLDLVDAIIRAIRNDRTIRREYVIAGPVPITYRRMIAAIADVLHKKRFVVALPFRIAHGLAKMCQTLGLSVFFTPDQVLRFGEDRSFDISEALREIPFDPRSFEEGLRESLKAHLSARYSGFCD